jgi:hypothetical protein
LRWELLLASSWRGALLKCSIRCGPCVCVCVEQRLQVVVDSVLLAREICGQRRVLTPRLAGVHERILGMVLSFPSFSVAVPDQGEVIHPLRGPGPGQSQGDSGQPTADPAEPRPPPFATAALEVNKALATAVAAPEARAGGEPPSSPEEEEEEEEEAPAKARAARPKVQSMIRPEEQYLLRFDGGCSGNPGPGGAGVVIYKAGDGGKEDELWCGSIWLGDDHTNNEAEYKALIRGLDAARRLGIRVRSVQGWRLCGNLWW